MGVIKKGGTHLWGRGSNHAEGLQVDDLVGPIGGLADLAHADAAVRAGDAHARTRRDGGIGSTPGEAGSRGICS